jgi:hypothetical protein
VISCMSSGRGPR